jgi:hypothetical protein
MTSTDSGQNLPTQRPYVVHDRDRHGNDRFYLRRPRHRKVRLPGRPGDAEFERVYTEAVAAPVSMVADPRVAHFRPLLRRLLGKARSRAAERALPYSLTLTWSLDRLERQRFRCALTGLPFRLDPVPGSDWTKNPYQPSFDRIDCALGYEPANVRLVLSAVNFALNEWGESVFAEIAAAYLRTK